MVKICQQKTAPSLGLGLGRGFQGDQYFFDEEVFANLYVPHMLTPFNGQLHGDEGLNYFWLFSTQQSVSTRHI